MTRFEPEPSHAVRVGPAASSPLEEQIALQSTQNEPASAQGYGLARASLQGKPAEKIGTDSRTIAAAFERLWLAQREPAGDAAGNGRDNQTETGQTFAQSYGSARAGVRRKPAEEKG